MLVHYFLGAAWVAGSAISSGLFVPMLVMGCLVGRLLGLAAVDIAAALGHGSLGYCCAPSPAPSALSQALSATALGIGCSWQRLFKTLCPEARLQPRWARVGRRLLCPDS